MVSLTGDRVASILTTPRVLSGVQQGPRAAIYAVSARGLPGPWVAKGSWGLEAPLTSLLGIRKTRTR